MNSIRLFLINYIHYSFFSLIQVIEVVYVVLIKIDHEIGQFIQQQENNEFYLWMFQLRTNAWAEIPKPNSDQCCFLNKRLLYRTTIIMWLSNVWKFALALIKLTKILNDSTLKLNDLIFVLNHFINQKS